MYKIFILLVFVSYCFGLQTVNDTLQARSKLKVGTTTVKILMDSSGNLTANGNLKSNSTYQDSVDTDEFGVLNNLIDRISDSVTTVAQGTGITVTKAGTEYTVSLYQAPNIVSITNNKLTNYIGQTVTSVDVSWTLSGSSPTSQTLTDCTLLPTDRSYSFTGLSLTSDKTYSLSITDGVETDNASTVVRFYVSKYYGTTSLSAPTEAAMEAGTNTWVTFSSSNRSQSTITITGAGKYIYYAYPASWGDINLYVNGFLTGWKQTTVSVTNAYGDTRDYRVYTSPTTIVGAITLSATGI